MEDDAGTVSATLSSTGSGGTTVGTGTFDSTDTLILAGTDTIAVSVADTTNITTGAAAASVAVVSGKTATIDATAMADDISLSVSGAGNHVITGLQGDLAGSGATGSITVTGLTTAQSIVTGSGNDTLTGGDGIDTMTGGTGVDAFNVDDGADVIADFGLGSEVDTIAITAGATVAVAVPASYAATATTDIANSAAAADVVFKLAEGVNFDAAASTDTTAGITITATGNTTASTIVGTDQADVITGGDADDSLTGGVGADTLTGGAGANTFVFAAAATDTVAAADSVGGIDAITDLVVNGNSADLIDLTETVAAVHTAITAGTVDEATFIFDMNALLAVGGGVGFANDVVGGISAALVTPNAGDQSGKTFLAVDINSNDTFDVGDFIIDVTGITTTSLTTDTFI